MASSVTRCTAAVYDCLSFEDIARLLRAAFMEVHERLARSMYDRHDKAGVLDNCGLY